jgi:L-aspartate oxidase
MTTHDPWECDYLVIGSGIAGLVFALRAADHGRVTIVTKAAPEESNTAYAQGGIASVLHPDDSVDKHVADTLEAGVGICKRSIVEIACAEGPVLVKELMERYGVAFDHRGTAGHEEELDLGLEGGHSARRVAHVGDATGRAVAAKLVDAVAGNDRIALLDYHMAVDLLTMVKHGSEDAVFGAFVLDRRSHEIRALLARATVLASGGIGKVYLYTSNPDVATGDGVAIAYRAGAAVADMEFMQFHPTCLYHPEAKSFLISEALRGEGGRLRLQSTGARFMPDYDERAELAPRDVVARAIDAELKRTGDDCVLLDMTHLDPSFLVQRFSMIHQRGMSYGIDMRQRAIPVVPAAHYSCGGVVVDEVGHTSIQNLYAIGEVACTGLHGANRLASNSLLEGLVFAARAAESVREAKWYRPAKRPQWESGAAIEGDEAVVVAHNWDEIRRLMWNYVGIVRSDKRLERARRRIALIREEIREYYWKFLITSDLLELRSIALVADLIIAGALERRESRGLHYNIDYPDSDPSQARSNPIRGAGPPI